MKDIPLSEDDIPLATRDSRVLIEDGHRFIEAHEISSVGEAMQPQSPLGMSIGSCFMLHLTLFANTFIRITKLPFSFENIFYALQCQNFALFRFALQVSFLHTPDVIPLVVPFGKCLGIGRSC